MTRPVNTIRRDWVQVDQNNHDRHLEEARAMGGIEARVHGLEQAIEMQRNDIKQLLQLASEGKGSLRVFLMLAGVMGGAVTWLVERFAIK